MLKNLIREKTVKPVSFSLSIAVAATLTTVGHSLINRHIEEKPIFTN